jgi:enoyl-CoA hydratase/carnithine racemase
VQTVTTPDGPVSGTQRDLIVSEPRDDGVMLLRMNRPKGNVLSTEMLRCLRSTVVGWADEPPGALVLWGGPRLFSAGADVAELATGVSPAEVAARFHAAAEAISALGCVTVAAVNGYALGGGLELALACDLRVVADDARLGQPEILLGIIPGGGATQRLPRLVGPSRAKDMILTGRQVHAEEALRIGLADRVAPASVLLEEALRLAGELAAGARVAQVAAKRAVEAALETSLASGLDLETAAFVSIFDSADARHGIDSFLEHGPGRARFGGR